jgi:hypothetical protein
METTMKKTTTTKVKKARPSKRAATAKFNAAVEGAQVRTPAGAFTVSRMAAQGDVLFRRVDAIPASAKQVETRGPIVVAHSETGHHHSLDEVSGAKLFTLDNDPLTCFLRVEGIGGAVVTHHRDFDTHAPLLLTPGNWQVKRQREYVPGGWRRVED